jgi:hypothetical protein
MAYIWTFYGILIFLTIGTFFFLHPWVLGKIADWQERVRKRREKL